MLNSSLSACSRAQGRYMQVRALPTVTQKAIWGRLPSEVLQSQRGRNPGDEFRSRPEWLLGRPATAAFASAHRRSEGRSRKVNVRYQELTDFIAGDGRVWYIPAQ